MLTNSLFVISVTNPGAAAESFKSQARMIPQGQAQQSQMSRMAQVRPGTNAQQIQGLPQGSLNKYGSILRENQDQGKQGNSAKATQFQKLNTSIIQRQSEISRFARPVKPTAKIPELPSIASISKSFLSFATSKEKTKRTSLVTASAARPQALKPSTTKSRTSKIVAYASYSSPYTPIQERRDFLPLDPYYEGDMYYPQNNIYYGRNNLNDYAYGPYSSNYNSGRLSNIYGGYGSGYGGYGLGYGTGYGGYGSGGYGMNGGYGGYGGGYALGARRVLGGGYGGNYGRGYGGYNGIGGFGGINSYNGGMGYGNYGVYGAGNRMMNRYGGGY